MQRLIAILQIKGYNFADFTMWLKWYTKFIKCDEIYICDDNSAYDIKPIIELINPKVKYFKRNDLDFKATPGLCNNQIKIYNFFLDKIVKPAKDDIIILPDDDEFFWFDTTKYASFKDCVNDFRQKLGNPQAIVVPWTLMRSREIMQTRKRTQNFAECFTYRSSIDNCEHKPIMFYNGLINTTHHCGYADFKTITAMASKTSLIFSHCKYDLPLRCYHYRFTTVSDYAWKMSSDVAKHIARTEMGCSKDFTKFFENKLNQNEGYDTLDLTVNETLSKL